jgi:hypothetical protein
MGHDHIPDDIRAFIVRFIDSVTQLEALLLVRANPDEAWDVAGIAKRLYVSEHDVIEALNRLCANGLLDCSEHIYRYTKVSAENQANVERLALLYSRYLIPITNIIHSNSRPIRAFADAFKFRKDT